MPDDLQQRMDQADVAKAEAEARSAAAKAEQDATDARTSRLAELVPDFGKVKDSVLEVKDGPAILGTSLTYRALAKAAGAVPAKLPEDRTGWRRLLVTSDADLATADAAYAEVRSGLEQLQRAAAALLPPEEGDEMALAADVAAVVASALPSALSLLTTQRSVATATVTVNDLAAAAAVVGALLASALQVPVVHDDFRLLPRGEIYGAVAVVGGMRQQLVERKTDLGNRRPPAGSPEAQELSGRVEQIDSVVAAIDTFNAAIRVVPPNAKRSLLSAAALHEDLHTTDGMSHVLLVKAEPGQAQQVTENRPLWFEDRFSTLVDVNLLYVLIETAGSTVLSAGTITATATAYGKIGADFVVALK
ncbi:hypothetical protein AMES_6329 [Amycolatopsis mediterranei S699]|uniref:Uncharacterized protein n=2 Tax=Amycolatopsis mediterranei TaxID=33910 RepID=A0A0H3DEU7_AMYMU|nr:hypothetical protein AMED_6422 [Amycolatopsis mediterranei U32]AEK45057.1 hypothetical protein RAM_32920 [Amycolatopsis mediterranei S699]AGT86993.1 hypothetical protein B737_6329 [Amycolatopsis mediterranei RB]KDO10639.1 hypothetical protein DV26_12170 [Amycolatopsis mediterranei]AFO79865.1 hypothetical protein AMES_6329 [Amycolatopsis mediterranei S699]